MSGTVRLVACAAGLLAGIVPSLAQTSPLSQLAPLLSRENTKYSIDVSGSCSVAVDVVHYGEKSTVKFNLKDLSNVRYTPFDREYELAFVGKTGAFDVHRAKDNSHSRNSSSYSLFVMSQDLARAKVIIADALRSCSTASASVAPYATPAPPPRVSARWGALAIDANAGSRYGWAQGYAAKEDAMQRAKSECDARGGGSCGVVLTFSNGCAAYAASESNGRAYGWGHQASESAAKSRALSECGSRGGSCQVRAWACN